MGFKALITGCAGFIGSTLTDRLLRDGYEVIGIDRFSDYYGRNLKEQNLSYAIQHPMFTLIEEDIVIMDSFPQVDFVFHLAAQAGVRSSWGKSFDIYSHDNILATQKLLDFYKDHKIRKFVYSSSSSVYGDVSLPMKEEMRVQPVSPYGVSKLAAEHLCYLYWKNFQVPIISLRYFTVYGPRQRPDMGINKFFSSILRGEEIFIYGDGIQTRDFTYIDDVVNANVLAALCEVPGEIFNIGGGNRISINELIGIIEQKVRRPAHVRYSKLQKGDVIDTLADTTKAQEILGWSPYIDIKVGLDRYATWITRSLEII